MDRRDLLFSALGERNYFFDLLPVLYLSLVSLTFPSAPPFAPIGLSLPFLIVLFWHHFLQPFFLFVNGCDIEGGLFVRGFRCFRIMLKILKSEFISYLESAKRKRRSWFPNRMAEK